MRFPLGRVGLLLSPSILLFTFACGPECGPGTVELEASCVPTDEVCAAGTAFSEEARQCVADGEGLSCGPGTRLEQGQCVAIAASNVDCGDGTTLSAEGDQCVPTPAVCGDGTMFDVATRTCLGAGTVTCGPGTAEMSGACVPTAEVCGPGTVFSDVTNSCIRGQAFFGDCAEPMPIPSQVISEDIVFAAGGCFEFLGAGVEVRSTIRVEPGVTFIMSEGSTIFVSGGVLDARGTAMAPIRMRGASAGRGFWDGIFFDRTDSRANRLEHVIVEHAGRELAAVAFGGRFRSRASLLDLTIRESANVGLSFIAGTLFEAFDRVEITGSDDVPVSAGADAVAQLRGETTLTGNGRDFVRVEGGRMTTDQTWASLDVPYLLAGDLDVQARLELEAGIEIRVADDVTFLVRLDGRLITQPAPGFNFIGGLNEQRGRWSGLIFQESTGNRLVDLDVAHGGGVETVNGQRGNVHLVTVVQDVSEVVLDNCNLRDSAGYGLVVAERSELPDFSGNAFENNTLGAVYAPWDAATQLDALSNYRGNDAEGVVIFDGRVGRAGTLSAIDVPYRVQASTEVRNPLTVQAGSELRFGEGAALSVFGDGSLTAAGTMAEPILLLGEMEVPGAWFGLSFTDSDRAANRLEHVRLAHAGRSNRPGAAESASIYLQGRLQATRLSLSDVAIEDGPSPGIFVRDTVLFPTCQRVSFTRVTPAVRDARGNERATPCAR